MEAFDVSSLPENPKGMKRLKKELEEFEKEPIEDVNIVPHEQNPCLWYVSIKGSEGSPYEGGTFKLRMDMTKEYPFKAPELKMDTPIYHPSIRTEDGMICQEALRNNWKPVQNARFVINMMKDLIADPSQTSQPQEAEIYRLLEENPE